MCFCVSLHHLGFAISIIFAMLNQEKNWRDYHTSLSSSPVRCSHFTLEIQKKSFFNIIFFIYFRLFSLPRKKTNSNCCTAALAVYLLLFSASYFLHSPSTASGARYRTSVCVDMDIWRLAAAACCDVGWISAQKFSYQAWRYTASLQKIWKSHSIPISTKIRLMSV